MLKRILALAMSLSLTLTSVVSAASYAETQQNAEKPLLLWYDEPCDKTAEILDNSVTDRKG